MDQNRQVFELFEKLSKELASSAGKQSFERDAFQTICRQLSIDSSGLRSTVTEDEAIIVAQINLSLGKKSPEALRSFTQSYEQLSSLLDVPNRKSLLMLLYLLTDSGSSKPSAASYLQQRLQKSSSSHSTLFTLQSSAASTQIGDSSDERPQASVRELAKNFSGKCAVDGTPSRRTGHSGSSMALKKTFTSSSSSLYSPSVENLLAVRPTDTHDQMDELVQDVIYAFMGAQGKYLKKDVRGFILDPAKARTLSMTDSQMLLRLAELGYLHDQIIQFTNADSGCQPTGLFGQGLVTAIRNELTQYYGMVASLQEQVNRSKDDGSSDSGDRVTLIKLMLWAIPPLHRFQCILSVATDCQLKRGGDMASIIFNYQSNGDPRVKLVTKELLRSTCVPLIHMLSRWLLDGEIEDPNGEFFIESLSEITNERLWHDKYRVRNSLLPNFISLELANRILLIGKSINFLRVVCHDKDEIRDRRELELCLNANSDELFNPFEDTKLHAQIEKFCTNTSQKLLDIVLVQSNLMGHLQSIRNYLLLGQGDFVEMLMENLKGELDRPAKEIQAYNLSAILDATTRQSVSGNVEDSYLNNLNVVLLNAYEGDSGWDLFTLQYSVQGPLITMLEPSMTRYKIIFKHLWRIKHIELVLTTKIWKEQICNEKAFREMRGELGGITKSLNLLTSQMIHFISQIQFYILFEVIECEWTNLAKCVEQAESIDDILASHAHFLESIKARIFLDENSRKLSGTLESLYRTILGLETWQDKFYGRCYKELGQRRTMEEAVALSERLGQYGKTKEEQFDRDQEQKVFLNHLQALKTSLHKISLNYEQIARQFLLLLAESNDYNLQLFGTRIDYNEYYKKNDQRLHETLTYEKMRMSSMFLVKKAMGGEMSMSAGGAVGFGESNLSPRTGRFANKMTSSAGRYGN